MVLNGLPYSSGHRLCLPLTLLEPAFEAFQEQCFHPGTSARGGDLKGQLQGLYGGFFKSVMGRDDFCSASVTAGKNYRTDGSLSVNIGNYKYMVLNQEVKGFGDKDPLFQNDNYVVRAALNINTNNRPPAALFEEGGVPLLPCFMLDVHNGKVLVVRGCVVTPPCFQSEVLTTVSLVGPLWGELHLQLARVYSALRRGVATLLQKYKAVPIGGEMRRVYSSAKEPGSHAGGAYHWWLQSKS